MIGWPHGLRARVTAAFALAALALALVLSLLTYTLGRTYLMRQREASTLRQASVNARLVQDGLRAGKARVPELLDALETPASSDSLVEYRGRWFASSPAVSPDHLPGALRRRVEAGTPAHQHVRVHGGHQLAVGVPLPAVQAAYFELFTLAELDRTLRVLAMSLLAGSVVTVLLGVCVGRWASGQALRPLAQVSRAAQAISQGRLNTRLDAVGDAELRVLAASFNDMADALQQRIERDARFALDVSHELRSPLTTLATAVEVLHARRGELPETARDSVELLRAEIHRFQRMVLDLLEISRLEGGVATLALEEVRPAELVRRAVAGAQRSVRPVLAAGAAPLVEVAVDEEVADLVIQADKRRLEQIVANLVENAETHGGGLVGVRVAAAGDRVRVLIDDAGPGVPPAYRERIFQRFSRGPPGSRRGVGTGLGLALVAEHVRLHQGRVWVQDRPGGGARFTVELPAQRTSS